jgi:hypothetical protein
VVCNTNHLHYVHGGLSAVIGFIRLNFSTRTGETVSTNQRLKSLKCQYVIFSVAQRGDVFARVKIYSESDRQETDKVVRASSV